MTDDTQGIHNAGMIPLKYSLLAAFFAMSFGFAIATQFFTTDVNSILFATTQPILLISFGTTLTGTAIGIFLGAWLCSESGRKVIILSSSLFGMCAFAASCVASNLSLFLSSYFVVGITFGLYFLSVFIYIAEISLSTHRGLASSFILIMFISGFIVAKFLSSITGFSEMMPFLIAYGLLNIIFFIICMVILPESPRWLASVGLSDSALNALSRLRLNMGMAARELASINESTRRELRGVHLYFQNQHFRKALWLYGILALFLHWSGISFIPNILLFTMTDNIDLANNLSDSAKDILLYALLLVFLAAAGVVSFSIDKFGRRRLMLTGVSADTVLLFIIWLIFISRREDSTIPLIVLFLLFIFSSSLAAFAFLSSFVDTTPGTAREFASATILFIYMLALLLNARFVYEYSQYMNFTAVVFVQLIGSLVLTIVVKTFYPDTSNLSLEEIEIRMFQGRELIALGNDIKNRYS